MEHEKSTRFPDARQEGAGTAGSATSEGYWQLHEQLPDPAWIWWWMWPKPKVIYSDPQPPGREPEGRG